MNKLLAIFVGFLALSPLTGLAYFDQNLYFGLQKNVGVTALQEFLIEQGFMSGQPTGNFFSLTLKAVKAFQTSKGISPTSGYFGPLTRAAANNVLASQGVSEGVTDEAGVTINPPITSPKTNDDVVAKLNETIEQLKKQVAEAEKTNTSLAEVQTKQAEQKVILESQQQKLGAIQENTTPAPVVEPTPVIQAPRPDFKIDLEGGNCRPNVGYGTVCEIKVINNGAATMTVTASDGGTVTPQQDGTFQYIPVDISTVKTFINRTITVTGDGHTNSKTFSIEFFPKI